MLSKRVFLILFLLVISIGSISAVCAEDATGDIISNASDDEIGVNDENIVDLSDENVELTDTVTDELKSTDAGTFTALKNKLENAQEGSTITLENDYKYTSSDGNNIPMITKSLTINGNGHTIDGSSQTGLLKVLGKKRVILNNIVFKNGYANEVIRVDNVETLKINNCNFVDNAGYFGGALIVTNSEYFEMNKTTFENNNGYLGGALYTDNTKNLFFFECVFNTNYAENGGAFYLENHNQTYFGGCRFAENRANNQSGAIYLENGNYNVIDGCTFARNFASVVGGAITLINMAKSDIYGSIFTKNKAAYGGAVTYQSSNDIYLAGDKFDENTGIFGGAMYFLGTVSCLLNGCNFIQNVAELSGEQGGAGGAIYAAQNKFIQLYACDFNKNTGEYMAGALCFFNTESIIEKTNFTSNKGYLIGGVLAYDATAAFHRCNFVKNTAEDGVGGVAGHGGEYGTLLIDCTLSGNGNPQADGVKIFYGVKLSAKQSGSTSDNKVITATLTRLYGGSVIANQYVTFKVNGKTHKVKTNAKGQAILKTTLPAKKQVVTITHEGSGKYLTNSTKITVVVKKATPKIIASKKTFKQKTRTKAYTITLKNSVGKVMKNTKVKLTVKGKTYSATTNSYGKATFKITQLTARGSFPATIKFAGNSYYNAVSKKVTISVTR